MKRSLGIIIAILAAVWTPLFVATKTTENLPVCCLLAVIYLICGLATILCWSIIFFTHLKADAESLLKSGVTGIERKPGRTLIVLIVLMLSMLTIMGVVGAVAAYHNFLKTTHETPGSSSTVSKPERTPTTADLEIQLTGRSPIVVSNVIVLLSGIANTAITRRATLSDADGLGFFNGIPPGAYWVYTVAEKTVGCWEIQSTTVEVKREKSKMQMRLGAGLISGAVQIIDGFPLEKADLSTKQIELLDRFAARLPKGTDAFILGFSDSRGPWGFNERMGQKRGEAVADFLSHAGVSPERVQVFSLGERKPAVPNLNGGTPRNRRVVCLQLSPGFFTKRQQQPG